MTAPSRAGLVDQGLKRFAFPPRSVSISPLQAVLDISTRSAEPRSMRSLIEEEPRRAAAIGEGAVLRLWHGARCFDRYRRHFGLDTQQSRAA